MSYIPHRALENLHKYKYNGVDKSILSIYVLNPYWNQLVKLWPKWVAPNTITLTGFSLVLINFFTMLIYDPQYLTPKGGAEGPPRWIYFTWAIGLFLYQSLDAIDGKQARRTGMAGPLGEMFDHGIDAMNTTLEAIIASYALNLGRSWWTVAAQVSTLANFYLTTWEEFHTRQLYLGVFSGPVEGILMIVAIYVITGLHGPEFWDTGIFTFLRIDRIDALAKLLAAVNIPLNELFMVFGGVALAFNIATSYRNVYRSCRASRKSTVMPLLRLLPFVLSASSQILWLLGPNPSDPSSSVILNSTMFVPFLLAWGLQFAHQVGRMILAHLTQQRAMPWFGSEWVFTLSMLGGVDANMQFIFGNPPMIQTTHTRTALVVTAMLIISAAEYGHFVYLVINDITEYLGIACFTVRKKDATGLWQSAVPREEGGAESIVGSSEMKVLNDDTGAGSKVVKEE